MLLIKQPIQGGAAGTHTFSKLSFSQILRTRPSLNRNCTHSEIYRPVPSLAGMPVPVPAPDGARTPVPSLAGTPVPVLLPFGTLEFPPPPTASPSGFNSQDHHLTSVIRLQL